MTATFTTACMVLQLSSFCLAQRLTPNQALSSYLSSKRDGQHGCAQQPMDLQIDAALPGLRKQGNMSGLRLVSATGHVVYRGLRFAGDGVVKRQLIARYLNMDQHRSADARDAIGVRAYKIAYAGRSVYNGSSAYVFRLKPKRKQPGLLKGELWLNANTAAPLRVWGDLVRSPSIFIRSLRIVQDYQQIDACSQPLRLLVTARTRIAGEADLTVWWHAADTHRLAEAESLSSRADAVSDGPRM